MAENTQRDRRLDRTDRLYALRQMLLALLSGGLFTPEQLRRELENAIDEYEDEMPF